MRTIENRTATLNEVSKFTYGEMIMTCVKAQQVINGQAQPITYDNLKKIEKIDNVIGENKSKKSFDFEDSDYEFLKDKVLAMPWAVYHKEFILFTDYIKDLPANKKK